ncbi:es-2 protein - related [Anaeramoeba flamelloides]|uniref:Es-2 protein - related n=1 Tax=Anaeramoeba flamelloides TaxID=1746091 RepID=A0AAV7YMZ8_9EUKA|nr:es-2 protein - related [Anaeramoeba flamelloides]
MTKKKKKKRIKPKQKVLTEEEYLEGMSKIIGRDYFPDLESLKKQYQEFINNLEGIETNTEQDSSQTSENKKINTNLSLDEYLSTYTSEDNFSFEEISEKDRQKFKANHKWLKESEELNEKMQKRENGPHLLTWSYKAKNALMFVPKGTNQNRIGAFKRPARVIYHQNTRVNTEEIDDLSSVSSEISTLSEIEETPKVQGYGFVATPRIEDEIPIMTWGEIASLPVRIDTNKKKSKTESEKIIKQLSGKARFQIPKLEIGEKMALEMSKKAKENLKKRKTIRSLSNNSNNLRNNGNGNNFNQMSQAGIKLVQNFGGRGLFGNQLLSPMVSLNNYRKTPKLLTPLRNNNYNSKNRNFNSNDK